ncbi:MAG: CTP synthetase [Planctomycetota bacterium]|nr:MAG: CTP synthetase [Planctomycetota bacterium]
MSKFIFVTGGVVSSLGKGIAAGALGLILKECGLTVRNQKLDPYLNVDPGTMSPSQHGEVFVTDDGTEADLDLGHYERFTGVPANKYSNFTAGSIYFDVLSKERRGDYLGRTVQIVPHITDYLKQCILSLESDDVDVVISEIGGTVGDIEGLFFLETLRQIAFEKGRENVMFLHVTLIPHLNSSDEIKTKPTQHSVQKLREVGISPDVLVCRTVRHLDDQVKSKISLFCNVPVEAVIEEKDVERSIYEVPFVFLEQNLDKFITNRLNLKYKKPKLVEWKKLIKSLDHVNKHVKIGIIGKYIDLNDSYKSIIESLQHAALANKSSVEIDIVPSEDMENETKRKVLKEYDGILVPGGFGDRGVEGKLESVRFAREKKIPFLGICLGMQCATIEFARNVCKLSDANSTEFNPKTEHPVISLLEEQKKVVNLGGTMRLGAYPCSIQKGSKASEAYNSLNISERHRHRYEFNDEFHELFVKKGMVFSGYSPDKNLIEIIELKDHPWFIGCQFHPEFKSRPIAPHPLFKSFIKASIKNSSNVSSKKKFVNKVKNKKSKK